MQKIVSHLWFDKEAKEVAEFYTSVFPDSRVTNITEIRNTPSGDCDIVSFQLAGQEFQAISAGPVFKINPSISFMVNFDPSKDENAQKNLDTMWEKLSQGGTALMPIQEYPFSKRYGWIQDKYGVSWQLILTDPNGEERPFIVPSLLFVNNVSGKAEEAIDFYLSVFKDTKKGTVARYPKGMEPEKEGTLMFADFMLEGQWFAAMDSANKHEFNFNEAVSLIVNCKDQEEIDYYWDKLSAVPESEQCGWVKDQYGVSWQIVPANLDVLMQSGTQEQIDAVTKSLLDMKKLDMQKLKDAHELAK